MTGEPLWEFIERGGSYAAPLALLVLRILASALRDVASKDGMTA
jgi:hypothetical protein